MNHSKGNVLFMLLIGIVLVAALTYAVTRSDQGGDNINREQMSLATDQLGNFGSDIRRGIETMTRAGRSENSVLFAHAALTGYGTPDSSPSLEIFNIQGGGASFVSVPSGANNGNQWEFYGFTAAPGVGDDSTPDLLLVLPNVTEKFCRALNRKAGYAETAAIPTDSSTCLHDTSKRFAGAFASGVDINAMDSGTFRTPALYACVACTGPVYHAYYTLIER